jgi:UDP-GlcNAc:undecaprenyl-phosphate GlcNAc-1-phosphate transferase
VPFVDTALAVIRRARRRTALSLADKEHLHHKLMAQGHGPRRSVFILWAWTAILAGVVLVPTYTNQGNAVVPFAVIGLAVVLYTLLHPGVRQTARQLEEEVDAPDQSAPPEPAGVAGPGPPPPG